MDAQHTGDELSATAAGLSIRVLRSEGAGELKPDVAVDSGLIGRCVHSARAAAIRPKGALSTGASLLPGRPRQLQERRTVRL